MIACSNGHIDVVKWLVCEGKANVMHSNKYGLNAYLFASVYGHTSVLRYLLHECHVPPNCRDEVGEFVTTRP